jgi:hypothetical protein
LKLFVLILIRIILEFKLKLVERSFDLFSS